MRKSGHAAHCVRYCNHCLKGSATEPQHKRGQRVGRSLCLSLSLSLSISFSLSLSLLFLSLLNLDIGLVSLVSATLSMPAPACVSSVLRAGTGLHANHLRDAEGWWQCEEGTASGFQRP